MPQLWRPPASRLEGEGGTPATSRWRGGTLSSTGTRRETWRRGEGRPACLGSSPQNAPQPRCSRSPMPKACSALRGASNLCENLCLRLHCALLLLAGWALRLTHRPPRPQVNRCSILALSHLTCTCNLDKLIILSFPDSPCTDSSAPCSPAGASPRPSSLHGLKHKVVPHINSSVDFYWFIHTVIVLEDY